MGCGKTGIRTLGTRKGTTVFETAPIDHSGIFPRVCGCKFNCFFWFDKIYAYLIFAEFSRWLVAGPWLVTPRRKSGYDGAACSPALGLVAQVERQQCIAALTVIDKKCLDMRHKFNCGTYPADSKGEKFAATHHYAGKNNIGTDDC